tara:strand:- start:507 stop:2939 length:2433 start_codon:yes stop_codon:yes gene_type:complete
MYYLYFIIIFSTLFSYNKIDINQADLVTLKVLPLTDRQIQSIINFRNYNGYFENIYELKNVDGITNEKIHELKSFIKFQNRFEISSQFDKNYSYKVSQWLSSDGSSENLSESWLDRYFNPMNINDMNYDNLMSLPNISPIDAIAVLNQKKRGYINGTFELKNSPGISRWGYKNLVDFISFKSQVQNTRIHYTALFRTVPLTSRPDDESGYLLDSNQDKPEILNRFRINLNNNIQAGILFHRNMGENKNINTLKASFGLNDYKVGPLSIDKLILGNYNASLAQGVVFETGDDFSPRRSGYGFSKRISGIEMDLTRSSQYTMNGLGLQVSNRYFRGIFISSYDKKDAIINEDGSFSSLIVMKPRYDYGITNDSSIVFESMVDAVGEFTLGGHLRITPVDGLNIGYSYYESLYNRLIKPKQLETIIGGPDSGYSGDDYYLSYITNSADSEVNSMYSFDENNIENLFWNNAKSIRRVSGLDITYVLGRVVFQTEYGELFKNKNYLSFESSNPSAIVASIYSDIDIFNFLALYRKYDLEFDNPYQRSFSNYSRYKTSILEDIYWLNDPAYGYLYTGNPQPQAEEGLFISSRFQFHKNFILTLNWDNWNRISDNTKYYRIVSTIEWRPTFNFRIKYRQKWQERGQFNIFHPSPFQSKNSIISARLNLSNFNRLELIYGRGNTVFSPRPRLNDSAIGGDMTVGSIGNLSNSIGFNIIHNYANNFTFKFGTILGDGFIWFFEDTDFRILNGDNQVMHHWASFRIKPNPNLTLYLKFSKGGENINTTITSGQDPRGIWISNPNTSNNTYDYKFQLDYAL